MSTVRKHSHFLPSSFMTGFFTSTESSAHFAGRGRNLFTFRLGVLQVGTGQLEKNITMVSNNTSELNK